MSADATRLLINSQLFTVGPVVDTYLVQRVGTALQGLDPSTFQAVADKGIANGYASLDSGGVVPTTQIPALSATGDATGTGTAGTGSIPLTLADTTVTPGSYTSADITVDSKGRITAASNGSGGGGGSRSYMQSYTSIYTTPSNLVANTPLPIPLNDPPQSLQLSGNITADFTPITGTYQLTYGGTAGTFFVQFFHSFFYPSTTTASSTQMKIYIAVNGTEVAGGSASYRIFEGTTPRASYNGVSGALVSLNPADVLQVYYLWTPAGATTVQATFFQNTLFVDKL